jgi:4-oxalocrotonate tautomerase
MPLVRISFREGMSAQYRRAVADEVHGALVDVARVPELDRFQVLTKHAPVDMIYDATYLGVKRSDDIVMIQITLNQRPQHVNVKAET